MSARSSSWRDRDTQETSRQRAFLERRGVSAFVAVVTFVVFFYAMAHENNACGLACYDISERPYEGGLPWTAYQGSWQWQAQWLLALAGFGLSLAALVTSFRQHLRRWTWALEVGGVVLAAGWLVWRALEPALPSI